MKSSIRAVAVALLVTSACAKRSGQTLPPSDRFDFPVSVRYANASVGAEVLHVANSNFDLGFLRGSVMTANLAGLPKFGAFPSPPVDVKTIGFGASAPGNQVFIDNFAGNFDASPKTTSTLSLFVPTREKSTLFVVDATGPKLSCRRSPTDTTPAGSVDCAASGIAMYVDENNREEDSFTARVVGGSVFVSALRAADRPRGSGKDPQSFVSSIGAATPFASPTLFPIGVLPAYQMVAVGTLLYFTGRPVANYDPLPLRRFDPSTAVTQIVWLTPQVHATETRGAASSCDGTKLFIASRFPDALIVVDVAAATAVGANATSPTANLTAPALRIVDVPKGPTDVKSICRSGRGDLVVVSCTDAATIAFYDADAGAVVASVRGLDAQPYGLSLASCAAGTCAEPSGPVAGARVFVAAFERGTVDVIDLLDTGAPQDARLVAHLGCPYVCGDHMDLPECQGC
jgi:hypothetical protein